MESVTILSFAAISAFACYIAIVGTNKTWLRLTSTNGVFVSFSEDADIALSVYSASTNCISVFIVCLCSLL